MFKTLKFKEVSLATMLFLLVAIQYLLICCTEIFTIDILSTQQHIANAAIVIASLWILKKSKTDKNTGNPV
jgi:heme A synthase